MNAYRIPDPNDEAEWEKMITWSDRMRIADAALQRIGEGGLPEFMRAELESGTSLERIAQNLYRLTLTRVSGLTLRRWINILDLEDIWKPWGGRRR